MKWLKKSTDESGEQTEAKRERKPLSKVAGKVTGTSVHVIKSVPSVTKNKVSASVSNFRDGFRDGVQTEDDRIEQNWAEYEAQ